MLRMPLGTNFGISRFFGFVGETDTVMQFTGVRDKDGKDVYEGDVIVVPLYEYPLSYGPSIKVGDDAFEVFWDTDMSRWGLRELNLDHSTEGLCDYDESDIKIVGNIHENPDLK